MDWDIEVEKYVYDTEITFDEHIQEAYQTMMKLPNMDEGKARMMIDGGYLSLEGVSEASADDLVEAGIEADHATEIIEYAKSRLQ